MHDEFLDTLYEDDFLSVKIRVAGKKQCIFTFTPWSSKPPADPFGAAFIRANFDCDAVFFVSKVNDWWQNPSIEHALLLASDRTQASRRITYGSSMGGFAAIAFASRLKCQDAIAISPQASIDRRVAPWETRWADEARRYQHSLGNAGSWATKDVTINLIYDNLFVADRKHAQLISEASTDGGAEVRHFTFGFSGHPSGPLLASMKLLGRLISGIIDADLTESQLREMSQSYRRRRKNSKACATAFLTNWDVIKRHPQLAARNGKSFKLLVDWDGHLGFLLARALFQAGFDHEAEIELRDCQPTNEKNRREISALLEKLKKKRSATS